MQRGLVRTRYKTTYVTNKRRPANGTCRYARNTQQTATHINIHIDELKNTVRCAPGTTLYRLIVSAPLGLPRPNCQKLLMRFPLGAPSAFMPPADSAGATQVAQPSAVRNEKGSTTVDPTASDLAPTTTTIVAILATAGAIAGAPK